MTLPPLNILVSFPYMSPGVIEQLRQCGPNLRLLLDCGAYTAWTSGKPIDLDEYCRFLEAPPVPLWRYFALDVVGDPEATWRNYEVMLKRGFRPLPIMTPGESLETMDRYYETSDVVGLGGLNALKPSRKHNYVRTVMAHAAGRKVHLLGYTTLDHLKALRPYMCDASSWESGARYAMLNLYMGRGKVVMLKKRDFIKRPPEVVLNRIRELGMDPFALSRTSGWAGGYSTARRLCGAGMVRLSIDVEQQLGTRLFLACAARWGLVVVREAYERVCAQQRETVAA